MGEAAEVAPVKPAEEGGAPGDTGPKLRDDKPKKGSNRMLFIILGAVFVVMLVIVVGMLLVPKDGSKKKAPLTKNVKLYSNLDLKDAADIKKALEKGGHHDLKIVDGGSGIEVPRKEADDIRLELASAGLPKGSSIGFEIFDGGSGLGATDFDKQIKLSRAIAGEVARNVMRIAGVDDARVQIVIPQKSLFQKEKNPVLASVFVKVMEGVLLHPDQVDGIVQIAIHSVEELKAENVSIVDFTGRTLTSPAYEKYYYEMVRRNPSLAGSYIAHKAKKDGPDEEDGLEHTSEVSALLKFKRETEAMLENKAYSILQNILPKFAALVKVNVEVESDLKTAGGFSIAHVSTTILVDKKNKEVKWTPDHHLHPNLKKEIFNAVSGVTGYISGRDVIQLSVANLNLDDMVNAYTPEGQDQMPDTVVNPKEPKMESNGGLFDNPLLRTILFIIGFVVLFILARKVIFPNKKESFFPQREKVTPQEIFEERPEFKGLKEVLNNNPAKVASLIKRWLMDESSDKATG